MDNELISIIVPVYNVEKYIAKCLDSLVNQTYLNIEILLIDDGSTDKSLSICKKYAAVDSRIKLFSKENGGVSSARNLGLLHVQGEYVVFVDSDDFVSPKYCEHLYQLAINTKSELASVSRYNILNKEVVKISDLSFNQITSDEALRKFFLGEGINCYLFSKIFKYETIKGLRFDESLESAEDVLFIYQTLKNINFASMDGTVADYFYILREGSLTNKRLTSSRIDSSIRVAEFITRDCNSNKKLKMLSEINEISLKGEVLEWISLNSELRIEFEEYYNIILREVRKFKLLHKVQYLTLKKFIRLILLKVSPRLVTILKNK